ncbi:MAG: RNA-binding protein [Gammaproteobacteria bacterium]|nr:RNA-binding protein [Gammaproteobacteria bacterium]MCH9744018.1 RNA-binding protein [Gammaproteobacteria bacterium]
MKPDTLHLVIAAVAAITIFLLFISYFKRRKNRDNNTENVQIYVGNLPYRANEYDLKRYFSHYGTITHVRIVKNHHTGQSKGFAFITFTSTESSKKALDAHGVDMKGRNMVVRIAKPRAESPSQEYVNA